MKLTIFLFFGFFLFYNYSLVFKNDGYLQKDRSIDSFNGKAIYLDTNEFKGDSKAYLKITVHHGNFKQDYLYHGGYDSTPDEVNLDSKQEKYFSSKYEYKSEYSDKDNDDIAYFKVSIPKQRYLFVSIPTYDSFNGSAATVNFDSTHSVGEIVGIIIGVIAGLVIVILFIAWCVKKRNKRFENNDFQTVNNPPLVRLV